MRSRLLRFLLSHLPAFLGRQGRRFLTRPGLDPREHLRKQPPRQEDPVRLMGFVWAEYNQAAPSDFGQYESLWTQKGHNWAVWENALTTRILARGGTPANEIRHVSGNNVLLSGEVNIDLASMFDLVVLGHWWPEVAVNAIKARSTAPSGTKVLLWTQFESVRQRQLLYQAAESWTQMRVNALTTVGANVYGDFTIDKFEATTPNTPGSGFVACPHTPLHAGLPLEATQDDTKHTWDVDIGAIVASEPVMEGHIEVAYVEQFEDIGYAGADSIDGVLFENILETPWKGEATTDYPSGWTATYQAAWRTWLNFWRTWSFAGLGSLEAWGDGPLGTSVYDAADLPSRYIEQFFTHEGAAKTWAQIVSDLAFVRGTGLEVILAFHGTADDVDDWGNTAAGPPASKATWSGIVNQIHAKRIEDQVYVAAWQMNRPESLVSEQGYAFWQTGFRTPT